MYYYYYRHSVGRNWHSGVKSGFGEVEILRSGGSELVKIEKQSINWCAPSSPGFCCRLCLPVESMFTKRYQSQPRFIFSFLATSFTPPPQSTIVRSSNGNDIFITFIRPFDGYYSGMWKKKTKQKISTVR